MYVGWADFKREKVERISHLLTTVLQINILSFNPTIPSYLYKRKNVFIINLQQTLFRGQFLIT
jgi:hypothetical protein